jgi:SAM-dependent methyltransferase
MSLRPEPLEPNIPRESAAWMPAPAAMADNAHNTHNASNASPAWFRQHFNADYRTLYCGRTEEEAECEVEFAVARLAIERSETVLDLCCGYGRHLRAFARRGIAAVGIDLSPELLREAPRGPGIHLACADMRRLPFAGGEQGFPVLVNFFTSFGYFDADEENERAAREMARVLRPRGRFLIDLLNPKHVVRRLVPRSERRAGPFAVVEERWFDAARRRIEKRIELHDAAKGERRRYAESVRVYEEAEIRALLEREGLEVREVFGDFAGSPPAGDAPRLVVSGRRPP